ncbi:putative (di)nucleoside polyphosphate hydrolase [Faunimonas pinastri]|uniref:RNA pyrophosphohydrolase n=1 Tax=Faunimonas pinastri TaxID=1855383 RepID=A0A1H9MIU3_9HYPH|nr:RNA pyrophosphohydrolase [Faunimonas pinastri]SER23471.1 putative (di)nucleoside polyphosphate hydrolase [Faunimonas pinastri]
MTNFEQLPYRRCVGICVFNPQGLVWVGRRHGPASKIDNEHAWQLPQGGIDADENPVEAAVRELYEETSIRSVELLGESERWLSYDLPAPVVGQGWRGRYRGQTQKWFAFRFTGPESEIDVVKPGGGAHRPEFTEWRWEELERVPDLVIPFKREVYDAVAQQFARFSTPT